MTSTSESYQIEIRYVDHLQAPPETSSTGVLANLYNSANYVVLDVGLPRCHGQNVRVSISADKVLVEAERQMGERSSDQGRDFLLHELPHGTLARLINLPDVDLVLDEAEAHFANGMLVLSIPMAS